jgi:hypothetical protein
LQPPEEFRRRLQCLEPTGAISTVDYTPAFYREDTELFERMSLFTPTTPVVLRARCTA